MNQFECQVIIPSRTLQAENENHAVLLYAIRLYEGDDVTGRYMIMMKRGFCCIFYKVCVSEMKIDATTYLDPKHEEVVVGLRIGIGESGKKCVWHEWGFG